MSLFRAALNNTLDIATLDDEQLYDLIAELDEYGWELSYEKPCMEPGEFDTRMAQLLAALKPLRAEGDRRYDAAEAQRIAEEYDFERAAEHAEFEDGRHTLVG